MSLGRTLDIGSGIGRTLTWLTDSVGVDHNGHSINRAREQGLICFVNKDFHKSKYALNGYFDSLIFVHVLEHLTKSQADSLLSEFRKYLKPFGKLVIICPQEKGFKSDKTHVTFLNFDSLNEYGRKHQFDLVNKESFPFPRILGKIFRGNEFISVFISKI
jgi:2-polyprenyl-3-methyl-5-hydroxy-6-metoxy-1,4-benzoquinol methylase